MERIDVMKNYGLPYMGSKNKIAEWILSYLPKAENLYDLFCGGCAITHCAIELQRYKNYYINDINEFMPYGFIDCINGKYHDEKRWISHEEFNKLKGKGDLLVDLCFSFGNNYQKGYAYSKEIEPVKKAFHYALFYNDYSQMKNLCDIDLSPLKDIGGDIYKKYLYAKNIIKQRLDLQSLESLERLERLGTHVTPSAKSYDEIEIKPNSVIYCDIPYRSTATYNKQTFDYDKFYDWCLKQTEPLFISEYWMPEADFICIAEKQKRVVLDANNNSMKKVEKLFIPKHQQLKNEQLKLF